jgi:hypothetical protein
MPAPRLPKPASIFLPGKRFFSGSYLFRINQLIQLFKIPGGKMPRPEF